MISVNTFSTLGKSNVGHAVIKLRKSKLLTVDDIAPTHPRLGPLLIARIHGEMRCDTLVKTPGWTSTDRYVAETTTSLTLH